MQKNSKTSLRTVDIAYIGMFIALMAICSWISIPSTIPVTLQTLAVFVTVGLLGGKRGTTAVVAYVILGAVGMPVFAGFTGGIGILFGQSGGYIMGFILTALIMWGITDRFGRKPFVLGLSMVLGLLACYAFGTAWFFLIYMPGSGMGGLLTVLGWCVIPFLLPDLCKIAVALLLIQRLKHFVKL